MKRYIVGLIALASAAGAVAQNAPVSAGKQALVQRVLTKMPMENVGLAMLQAPVAEVLRQSNSLLEGRTTPEQHAAAMKDVNAMAAKFMEENVPLVRSNAQAAVASTVAPLLAQRFSEEELKQLAALLESPVKAKFEALAPEIQRVMGEKVGASMKDQINPKLTDLQQQIGLRLRGAVTPGAPAR